MKDPTIEPKGFECAGCAGCLGCGLCATAVVAYFTTASFLSGQTLFT